jgi:hypothetical protein
MERIPGTLRASPKAKTELEWRKSKEAPAIENVSDERQRLYNIINDLKQSRDAVGISAVQLLRSGRKVRDLYDVALESLNKYENETGEGKSLLAKEYRQQVAKLQSYVINNADREIQTIVANRPKEKERIPTDLLSESEATEQLGDRLEETLESYSGAEVKNNAVQAKRKDTKETKRIDGELEQNELALTEKKAEIANREQGAIRPVHGFKVFDDGTQENLERLRREIADLEDQRNELLSVRENHVQQMASKSRAEYPSYEGDAHYPAPAVQPRSERHAQIIEERRRAMQDKLRDTVHAVIELTDESEGKASADPLPNQFGETENNDWNRSNRELNGDTAKGGSEIEEELDIEAFFARLTGRQPDGKLAGTTASEEGFGRLYPPIGLDSQITPAHDVGQSFAPETEPLLGGSGWSDLNGPLNESALGRLFVDPAESAPRTAAETEKRENFDALRQGIDLAKRAGLHDERVEAQTRGQEYFERHKRYNSSGLLGKISSRSEYKALKESEKAYQDANLQYVNKMQDSASDRMMTPKREGKLRLKYEKMLLDLPPEQDALRDEKGKPIAFNSFAHKENRELYKRYNRLIRYKEIIHPTIQAKQESRAAALSEGKKSILGKLLNGYQMGNQFLEAKIGKTPTRALRLLVTTGAFTGGAISFGGVALGGAVAYGGSRLLRGVFSTLGGAALAKAAGKGFENVRTWQLREDIKYSQGMAVRNIKQLKSIQKLHEHGTAENIEAERQRVELAIGVLAGLGFTHETAVHAAQLSSIQKAAGSMIGIHDAPTHAPNLSHTAANPGRPSASQGSQQPQTAGRAAIGSQSTASHATAPQPSHSVPAQPAAAQPPTAPHAPASSAAPEAPKPQVTPETAAAPAAAAVPEVQTTPTQPEGKILESIVDHRGEGVNGLFASLKHQIAAGHLDPEKMSPVVKHIAEASPSELAHKIHAALGDRVGGSSLTTHMGDKFLIDGKGNLWIEQGGKPHLVMENDPTASGGIAYHELNPSEVHMQQNHPTSHAPRPEAARTVPAASIAAETAPTASYSAPVEATHTPAPASDSVPAEQPRVSTSTPQPYEAGDTAPSQPLAPVEHPTAPESVQVAPNLSGREHIFASSQATEPVLNQQGVDLSKPQMTLVGNHIFAHGVNTEDSFQRALKGSLELHNAKAPDTHVYFVAQETDLLGVKSLVVHSVAVPEGGDIPKIDGNYENVKLPTDNEYNKLPDRLKALSK